MVRCRRGWHVAAASLEAEHDRAVDALSTGFLTTAWFEHPFLVGQLKMLHWSALFVDNVISVLLLSVVVTSLLSG